ncbi:MAG: GNAT family N-acetyltransferase [Aeromonas sp.]
MELTFEEYCDADLSLIRDYYETTFSHYVPDLAERIFVVRDANWLVGVVRLRDEETFYHLCGFRLLSHYQSLGLGSRLLQYACRDLTDKPVVCQALPFEKPFYVKAGFIDMPLDRLSGSLFSLYQRQQQQGYQVELLVRDSTQPLLN